MSGWDSLDVEQELAAIRGQPQGTEARVCDDITERQALGISKYGKTVEQNQVNENELVFEDRLPIYWIAFAQVKTGLTVSDPAILADACADLGLDSLEHHLRKCASMRISLEAHFREREIRLRNLYRVSERRDQQRARMRRAASYIEADN